MINLNMYLKLLMHRIYFWDYQFWTLYLSPAMAMMSEQLAGVGMQQMQIVGSFLDADEQLEAQRDLQRMMARAHKDYHPSVEMCEFGSRVKSLALSQRQGELSTLSMSQRSLDRMLGNKSSISQEGRILETKNRLDNFKAKYCNPHDNNGNLKDICTTPSATPAERSKLNRDIDFTRTLAHPFTIGFNLTDTTPTSDEEDVFALSNNLYGFSTFPNFDPKMIRNNPSAKVNPLQQAYLDMRAYVAKQSVAENSFNALVALKSQGTSGSRQFLEEYLKVLGLPASEIAGVLGENPSYFAQMEILTKLAYQHPSFYTGLYDKPANVERKGVAIQAVSLIQKFDLLKSYMRTEASLSILLELSVQKLQDEIEDAIRNLSPSPDRKT